MKGRCLSQKGLRVRIGENACGCFKPIEDSKYMQCGDCQSFQQ